MRTLIALVALAAAALAEPVRVPDVIDLLNKKDPVNGKKVVEGQELDWHGVKVHFFGPESIAAFKKEPAKHLGALKLKLEGETLSLENATCPVTGKAVDRRLFHDRNGARVYVATEAAKAALANEPAKHYPKLGYAYVPSVVDLQNRNCPVTGEQCYPEAPIWVDIEGVRIRVCCDHCIREAEENPKRVFRAMMVDPEKLKKSVK